MLRGCSELVDLDVGPCCATSMFCLLENFYFLNLKSHFCEKGQDFLINLFYHFVQLYVLCMWVFAGLVMVWEAEISHEVLFLV